MLWKSYRFLCIKKSCWTDNGVPCLSADHASASNKKTAPRRLVDPSNACEAYPDLSQTSAAMKTKGLSWGISYIIIVCFAAGKFLLLVSMTLSSARVVKFWTIFGVVLKCIFLRSRIQFYLSNNAMHCKNILCTLKLINQLIN